MTRLLLAVQIVCAVNARITLTDWAGLFRVASSVELARSGGET